MDLIFGFLGLVVIGFIATFIVNVIFGYLKFRKQYLNAQIKDNNVRLRVEVYEQDGKATYLLYEATQNTFVMQSNTTEELVKMTAERFKDKTVFLIIPNGLTIPVPGISIPITSGGINEGAKTS